MLTKKTPNPKLPLHKFIATGGKPEAKQKPKVKK